MSLYYGDVCGTNGSTEISSALNHPALVTKNVMRIHF